MRRAFMAALLGSAWVVTASGQPPHSGPPNVSPVFEGWQQNADGSFTMTFGYFGRGFEEALDIPIGPNNFLEPGPADQGQPTHFFPRRNTYIFTTKVPKDFGNKDLVWTLTANGLTERAYATLKPEYVINEQIMIVSVGGFSTRGGDEAQNKAPVLKLEGPPVRTARVGEPLALSAYAVDDGIPKPRPAPKVLPILFDALGLRVSWFVYRGAGTVTFDPEQIKTYRDYKSNSPWTPGWTPPPLPPDGRFPVKVTFSTPGTYVLRVLAHDGGLASTQDVTVAVAGK